MALVAGSPDVGEVFLVLDDGRLGRERDFAALEGVYYLRDCLPGGFVEGGKLGLGNVAVGNAEVGYHLNRGEEVVKGDNGVAEHKQRFRRFEDIFERASGTGLKVFDAVVCNVTNRSTRHGRELCTWNLGHAVLVELFFELCEGVDLGAMTGAGFDHLAGVWSGWVS